MRSDAAGDATAVDLIRRTPRLVWLSLLVAVVGLMLLPYAAYGRGGPPAHAVGPPLSPPVGPPLSPPVGPP